MNTMIKTTLREIRQSLGRYLAILAIVALGVGIFSGLKVTKPFMVETAEVYLSDNQLYDFQLISTYGFEKEDVAYLARQEGVRAVEGSYTYDVLYEYGDQGTQVMKVHSIAGDINGVDLLAGRMPENADECILDAQLYGGSCIGQKIRFSRENEEDILDVFRNQEFTVCGVANAAAYMQFERGNTSIGNGKISGFMYVLPEAFDSEIYTEVYVKADQDFELYSEAYDIFVEEQEVIWEEHLTEVSNGRFMRIKSEAEEELAEAKEEFETEKADAQAELDDGAKELADAKLQLEEAKEQLNDAAHEIADGKRQISKGWQEITDGYAEIEKNEAQLNDGMAEIESNRQLLAEKEQELAAGIAALEAQQDLLNGQKAQLQESEAELVRSEKNLLLQEQDLLAYELNIETQLQAGKITEKEADDMRAEVADGKTEIEKGRQQIAAGREQITEGYKQIDIGQSQLDAAGAELDSGKLQIENGKAQLVQAEQEIASGKAQLEEGRRTLAEAEAQLAKAQRELKDGEAEYQSGLIEYEDGLLEYEDGLSEYEEGLAEFETKIADAEAEITDAEEEIAALEQPETFLLGRDTNVGYVCLESDSDIVADVSTVLPIFFFLIAALVCMTTMNRMIEEQRTQIGVLKALGYHDAAIMGKYLFYSGSAAFAGCVIGFFAGTYFLSKIIWYAYGIMYDMGEMVFYIDWGLLLFCFVCSMISTVGVTWFSCRAELSHVAAALMRPKAPKAGKRVFLEWIPFIWKRLSFLVKVSVRNVLRYKKRFFMMIVGISGCTALLVTGFGIQDSVADVTTMQYDEIILNDMSVTFAEAVSEDILDDVNQVIDGKIAQMGVFMEGSLDLKFEGQTKSISYVIPKDPESFGQYIDLHTLDGEPIAFPKAGEAVLSHKLAETFGIRIGDTVSLMDEDHNQFTVTISHICQNFVFNYIFLNADTCTQSWKTPEYQTIYINVPKDHVDIHQLSADLMALDDVANVTINQDVEERFNNMMVSLDFIVFVIIMFAAALAFIVLYNLTNINITERIREIATIKVLGFTKKETASYVFRENIALTAVGGCVGLLLGKIFHLFVMSCINIDMVAFDVRIKPESYLYSIALTFFFAWIINMFMGGKLDKISMTESLKSVD